MLVKQVMSTKIDTVTPTTTIRECARKMGEWGVGAIPIRQDGKLIGLVSDRDICCRVVGAGKDPETTPAWEVMSKTVTFCFEDQDCKDAARLMTEKGVRRLTVVNRQNETVGILSIDDLAHSSHVLAGEVLDAVAPWPH